MQTNAQGIFINGLSILPRKLLMGFACVAILSACKPSDLKTTEAETLPAEILFAGQMCAVQTKEPVIEWVGDERQWRRWQSDATRRIIGLEPDQAPSKPNVDFTSHSVVVVGLGQKNTGGYSISLREPGVQVAEGTLTVHVQTQAPAADAMVTQVITSPCVAVRVPKTQVSSIRAVDQQNAVLAQASVTSP